MELELATTAFVTLFVIIDPIGLTPLFVTLTSGMTSRQRRGVALRALITGAAILAVFGIGGEYVNMIERLYVHRSVSSSPAKRVSDKRRAAICRSGPNALNRSTAPRFISSPPKHVFIAC